MWPFQSTMTKVIGGSNCESWTAEYNIQPAYAVTYHKAQGQTLDDVFLAADKQLPHGLFYVGASRVRTRDGLHILHLNTADSICADPEALFHCEPFIIFSIILSVILLVRMKIFAATVHLVPWFGPLCFLST